MRTIDQLLESVDLDFEPRWVTKDGNGSIYVWAEKPVQDLDRCDWFYGGRNKGYGLKLSEFDGKDWTECIYEVPRKTTGQIEKLGKLNVSGTNMTMNQSVVDRVVNVLNQVIDAVNEINENYACIAALTDIRKRLDTLEKCVKNQRGE